MKIKFLDLMIFLAVAAVIACLIFIQADTGKNSLFVRIKSESGEYLYPLETDREISVDGPLGETTIIIKDRSVFISESPCPDKLCVIAGSLKSPGSWNACLPNKVFIQIEGRSGDTPDIISY